MKKIDVEELLAKYDSGKCSEQEKAIVETWYLKDYNVSGDFTYAQLEDDMRESLNKILPHSSSHKHILWPRIATAAAIFLIIGTGFFFFNIRTANNNSQALSTTNDVAPGSNKAFLTLADGKRITLTGAKTGKIAKQSGVEISKESDGQLTYTISKENPAGRAGENNQNIIETPKGGQYQINLPDGTKVWLNAASTLKYPASFASLKERRIELSGEAYFQVAKDKMHPFIVQTDKQEVRVLGTHFNVTAYANDGVTNTTLLEGSVQVGYNGLKKLLKPGQQLHTSNSASTINEIDAENEVAWKNGYFVFNEDLKSIMNKISRWYDVEVDYQSGFDSSHAFQGRIARNRNLSEVLKMLEYTGNFHFNITGRRIIIRK